MFEKKKKKKFRMSLKIGGAWHTLSTCSSINDIEILS